MNTYAVELEKYPEVCERFEGCCAIKDLEGLIKVIEEEGFKYSIVGTKLYAFQTGLDKGIVFNLTTVH